ncbi:MAG TPA: S8 family serine peptidase [Candidatus Eisenbacteria bacterium]
MVSALILLVPVPGTGAERGSALAAAAPAPRAAGAASASGRAALLASRPVPPRTQPAALAGNELLVALGDGGALRIGPGGRPESGEPAVAAALARFGLDRAAALGRPRKGAASAPRFLALTSRRADFDPLEAAQVLRATGRFRAVCPNYRLHVFPTLPNDHYLYLQWYVSDPGDADVDLPEAWDLERGGSNTTIGIMDTGVDTGHPDLASRIWINPGETPGNGLDDDGNGYVDDVKGWDFGNDDADPNPEPVYDAETGIDVGFHGTFVAGIACASTGNVEGIAGAGWNCRVVPLKVANAAGEITSEAVAAAFLYAADMGVSVLNMSLGSAAAPGVPEFFQALVDVADSAGVLCVASAGNDGSNTPTYPAACNHVLAVAALDDAGARADFSNYGSWVDIAAPGASMWSSICRNYVVDDYSQVFYLYLWYWDGEHPYMYGDGTSFACPLVSGVAGLLRHRAPSLPPDLAAQHLIATGDPLPGLEVGPKLNAYRAVSAPLVAVDEAPAGALGLGRVAPNPFRSSTLLEFTTAASGRVRLSIYDLAGRRVREIVDEALPAGRHARAWNGTSSDGARLASGVYVAVLESGGGTARQKLVLLR